MPPLQASDEIELRTLLDGDFEADIVLRERTSPVSSKISLQKRHTAPHSVADVWVRVFHTRSSMILFACSRSCSRSMTVSERLSLDLRDEAPDQLVSGRSAPKIQARLCGEKRRAERTAPPRAPNDVSDEGLYKLDCHRQHVDLERRAIRNSVHAPRWRLVLRARGRVGGG